MTDGFVGNVILKTCEGVFDFIMKLVAREIVGTLPNDRALASKAMHEMVARYDYSSFGGAPLIGIDGICIICHGSSGDRAIRNAIGVAAKYARRPPLEQIVQEKSMLSWTADAADTDE